MNFHPLRFFSFCIFIIFCAGLPAQNLESDTTRLNKYKGEAEGIVRFLQFALNTIGDPATPAREKDIIIQDSYLKIFQSPRVQIEDDLVADRSAVTNKDVQAYLKDVDFFFKKARVEFTDIQVEHKVNGNGELFFLVSMLRYLEGTTIQGDTVRNSQQRYVEINLDQDSRVLKIASIYTTRLGEEEELVEWWENLPQSWKEYWAPLITVRDSVTLSDLMVTDPYLSLFDSADFAIAASAHHTGSTEGVEYVGDLSVFNSGSSTNAGSSVGRVPLTRAAVLTPSLIRDLKGLVKTRQLDFSNNLSIIDISPLSQFRELRVLNISGTSVFDLTPLRNLTYLEVLDCSSSRVSNLEPLRYTTEIKELNLANSKITQLEPLTRFTHLRILNLAGTLVMDIQPLSRVSSLRDLDLTKTLIKDIGPIASLSDLMRLSVSGTRISDLQPLSSLLDLRHLEIENCPVKSVQPLAGCMSLRLLFIDRTAIQNLLPLKDLPDLSRIYCDHSLVTQADVLAFSRVRPNVLVVYESSLLREWWDGLGGSWKSLFRSSIHLQQGEPSREELQQMANVVEIDLSNQYGITSLQPLEVLVNLKKLNCSHTSVSSLMPLRDLNDVEELDLSYTNILDLQPLASMSRLTSLNVSNSPLAHLTGLEGASSLRVLIADSTMIQWLQPLDSLTRLQKVSIEGAPITNLEVSRFLVAKEEVLLIYQSRSLLQWWSQLSPTWKGLFTGFASLSTNPDSEALHRLTQASSLAFTDKSGISDLTPLSRFGRLKHLQLQGGMIRDVSPLRNLSSLETLLLAQNPIEDISSLSSLTRLKHLQIDNTLVTDLDPLVTMKQLQILSCKGSQVKSLKPLEYLDALRQLDVSNTSVRSLSPLDNLQNIKLIQCYNTKISTNSVQKFVQSHPNCEVVHY